MFKKSNASIYKLLNFITIALYIFTVIPSISNAVSVDAVAIIYAAKKWDFSSVQLLQKKISEDKSGKKELLDQALKLGGINPEDYESMSVEKKVKDFGKKVTTIAQIMLRIKQQDEAGNYDAAHGLAVKFSKVLDNAAISNVKAGINQLANSAMSTEKAAAGMSPPSSAFIPTAPPFPPPSAMTMEAPPPYEPPSQEAKDKDKDIAAQERLLSEFKKDIQKCDSITTGEKHRSKELSYKQWRESVNALASNSAFGTNVEFGVMSNGQSKFEMMVFDDADKKLPVLVLGSKSLTYPLDGDLQDLEEEALLTSEMALKDNRRSTLTPVLVIVPGSCKKFYIKVKITDAWISKTFPGGCSQDEEIILVNTSKIRTYKRTDNWIVQNSRTNNKGKFIKMSMPCGEECRDQKRCTNLHPGMCTPFDHEVEQVAEEVTKQRLFMSSRNCFFHAFMTLVGEKKPKQSKIETDFAHNFACMNVADCVTPKPAPKLAGLMTSTDKIGTSRGESAESDSYDQSVPHAIKIYVAMEDDDSIIDEPDYVQKHQEQMRELGYY